MEKIIDFGKFGKIDVLAENFTFDWYKLMIPTATIDMYKELRMPEAKVNFAKALIEKEEAKEVVKTSTSDYPVEYKKKNKKEE